MTSLFLFSSVSFALDDALFFLLEPLALDALFFLIFVSLFSFSPVGSILMFDGSDPSLLLFSWLIEPLMSLAVSFSGSSSSKTSESYDSESVQKESYMSEILNESSSSLHAASRESALLPYLFSYFLPVLIKALD